MAEVQGTQQVRQEVLDALHQARQRNYDQAAPILRDGIAAGTDNNEEAAVLHSTLGMILKKQGKMDEAWAAYQQAEEQLPDDPFIQIILSRFLLNERRDFDEAIAKAKQILKLAKEVPSIRHQAYNLLGLSYLRKGKLRKAGEMLSKAMGDRFEGMVTSDNIDFDLVEALAREQHDLEACQRFIQAAYDLARSKKEYANMTQYQRILESFETTNV